MKVSAVLFFFVITFSMAAAYIQNLNPYAKMNYFWAQSGAPAKREERNVNPEPAPRHVTRFVYFPSTLPFARPMKFPLNE
ncbi:unnamed protein product [Bursaphelenchus okinawaensis]|uniref:Uncharacterized protein n=1 Tax=Bursaphelenchus okinawaensis TaxID=465554 RepID=A0A811LA06_9BILA|nr:unnamed protein product [Bursaphelenchus okinawaensis]CAG9119327.1 unnamed protein product [Bursaphelenchus okinawaensis]